MRPGDALAELPTWLNDSSGTARGVWYLYCQVAIQVVTAIILGITSSLLWSQVHMHVCMHVYRHVYIDTTSSSLWSQEKTDNKVLLCTLYAHVYPMDPTHMHPMLMQLMHVHPIAGEHRQQGAPRNPHQPPDDHGVLVLEQDGQ
jgi:hypothetical protein